VDDHRDRGHRAECCGTGLRAAVLEVTDKMKAVVLLVLCVALAGCFVEGMMPSIIVTDLSGPVDCHLIGLPAAIAVGERFVAEYESTETAEEQSWYVDGVLVGAGASYSGIAKYGHHNVSVCLRVGLRLGSETGEYTAW